MGYGNKARYFVGDFETTVFSGQTFTEVWASAIVELYTEDVCIFNSIDETFHYLVGLKSDIVIYYHNLKFDGSFWIYFLLNKLHYEQALQHYPDGTVKWIDRNKMTNNTFSYSISNMGQFYTLTIYTGGHYIEFRDSLKLLPFTLKQIGESFKTKHQKLDMEYVGYRYSGCDISVKEREYIRNDVLVLKEALEFMFGEGHKMLTIGSCCLGEYKQIFNHSTHEILIGYKKFEDCFPDLRQFRLDKIDYGSENAEDYVRKSYSGGWCYVVPEKANKVYTKGVTADVNSLYPSVMHSQSGSKYPFGKPYFWKGNYIPEVAKGDNKFYFVRFKCRFRIKENYLPFIQIKGTPFYRGNDCLTTSDVYNKKLKKYCPEYIDRDGKVKPCVVTLTKTCVDFELIKEHYDLFDLEILDGCWFYACTGMFDEYIDKYAQIKMTSKGAKRTLAKLFLNNLYGKTASSDDSSFKIAYIKENGSIGYYTQEEHEKNVVYIPIGSAITSYARNFTIRTAQKNYHGPNERGFIYADTDSIHCDLNPDELVDVPVHPTEFCHWKLESYWDNAIFVRQKTYIEHVTHEDGVPVQELEKPKDPYYLIKCSGMGKRCKELLGISLQGKAKQEDKYTDEEKEFLFDLENNPIKRQLTDFKIGLTIPSNLKAKNIIGGVLLVNDTYCMNERI